MLRVSIIIGAPHLGVSAVTEQTADHFSHSADLKVCPSMRHTTYPMIETMRNTCRPRTRSPFTVVSAAARSRSIPFVKMRQAMSCGIVTSETCRPRGDSIKSHRSSSRKRYQLPPQSPDTLIRTYVPASRLLIPVLVRQRTHEAIEHRMVKLGRHDAGPVGRKPDLLLVMPAFGQLAGGVEPVR